MKGTYPRITLLGSNSGNNLGDAAILASIIEILSEQLPGARFYVPSTNPGFTTKNYGKRYHAKGINIMPWTGSIRLLGIPTLWCLARSDAALICDGIIFGKKLFNPLFNFLITLIFLVPWARICKCRLICYSCGIGPFPGYWSKLFARWTMNACDLVTLREQDSLALARQIGVTVPIEITGDAAFLNEIASDKRAAAVLEASQVPTDKPLLGINITRYIDGWLSAEEGGLSRTQFLIDLAEGIRSAQEASSDTFHPILFSTHPMDEPICRELASKINGSLITNSQWLSHDIQAVMRRCELFIGMRFHSLVLASAAGAPIMGLAYAPKVRGFMKLLDCRSLCFELKEITARSLSQTLITTWKKRAEIGARQQIVIDQLKAGARRAAVLLREQCFPELMP